MKTDPEIDNLIIRLLDDAMTYHPVLAEVAGGAANGIFLSGLWRWHDKGNDPNGWIYKTQEEWFAETRLSRREQETARKALRERGLLKEVKRGLPAKLYYKLDLRALLDAIRSLTSTTSDNDGGNGQTSLAENANLDQAKTPRKRARMRQTGLPQANKHACPKTPHLPDDFGQANTNKTPNTTPNITTSTSVTDDQSNILIKRIVDLKVPIELAQEWVASHSAARLEDLLFMCNKQRPLNPGGWFRSALQKGYELPPPLKKERLSMHRGNLEHQAGRALALERHMEDDARLAMIAQWDALPEEIRSHLRAQLMAEADALSKHLLSGQSGRGVLAQKGLALYAAQGGVVSTQRTHKYCDTFEP